MRHAYKKKILYCGIVVITLIILLHPDMNARQTYEYIQKESIYNNLHEEIAENFSSTALITCDYDDIIHDETTLSISLVDGDLIEGHKIKEGGEYAPSECKPKYSTAIIVPYRDQAEQLRGFLVYMHTFFHRQHIHYRIYVIEQVDSQPFNRAKLMNIGAVAAIKAGYPCLILHDVDLLPLRPANLYACTKRPRHMSSSIDKFRFVLPYLELFGGAIAITSKQYKAVNGMSNDFYGWRGEDDDLYSRLETLELKLCRFEPETSRYHMVSDKSTANWDQRKRPQKFSRERMLTDGLNSLKYTENFTRMSPSDFEMLLSLIGPSISRQETKFRHPIEPQRRLAIISRSLATGDSYGSLSYTYKVSKQLISKIVPEVCKELTNVLKDYVKVPSTEQEWKNKSRQFELLWNFPHCIGSIDGKHIVIEAPINSGSDFF